MLEITVGSANGWDEAQEAFVTLGGFKLQLEHSLFSLHRWESKWELPFLGSHTRNAEQTLDYIRCMTLNDNVSDEIYNQIHPDDIAKISEYIQSKQTATWIRDRPGAKNNPEVITAELMYYWLIALQIPFETQYWHLNKLLTLVKVCNEKNAPQKKKTGMTQDDLSERRRINAERRAKMNSRG